jgi:hypothetical protein
LRSVTFVPEIQEQTDSLRAELIARIRIGVLGASGGVLLLLSSAMSWAYDSRLGARNLWEITDATYDLPVNAAAEGMVLVLVVSSVLALIAATLASRGVCALVAATTGVVLAMGLHLHQEINATPKDAYETAGIGLTLTLITSAAMMVCFSVAAWRTPVRGAVEFGDADRKALEDRFRP